MKKLLLTLVAAATVSLTHAAVIINEPFSYPDGVLTNVSAGTSLVWTNHSGANNGSVMVAGGAIQLVTTAAEDVMRSLGVAYSNQTIFASFKVNFAALPTATTYFAHFAKDSSTFKSRIWSTTTGAAAGKFRLAITSSVSTAGAWTNVPMDLDLNTDYKVVMRFIGGTNATLWINPTSESSVVARADGTDANTLGTWTALFFAFRQSSGMGTMTIDDLLIGDQFSDVQTVGGPPSISGLMDVSIPANASTGTLPFLISDVETPAASLVVSATSDNPTLVPNVPASFSFGGAAGNRTLNVTPAAGQQGTANIEVVVTDASSFTATNKFLLTVGAPSIAAIPNQTTPTNTVLGPIAFTVGDSETAPGSLVVTATSSDQAVVADGNINIANLGGGNRTITITTGTAGATTIAVIVSDGTFNISTNFTVTAYPLLGLVLGESFAYPDGSVTTNSGFFWSAHSGTTGQTQVVNGKLLISATQTEDINAFLTNFPYSPSSGVLLYSRFLVNFSSLPTANGVGEYFAHFKEFGTSQFRARIFATTNGAAVGYYRLGIGNGGFVTTTFPHDLTPGASYVVISRYNVATATSTLWVSPTSEASTSVSATDLTTATGIYSYAFRQNTGIGAMSIDDLFIGTAFSDVYTNLTPTASALTIASYGSDAVVSWTDGVSALQSATNLTGVFTSIPTATSPYTNAASSDQKFFRLKY